MPSFTYNYNTKKPERFQKMKNKITRKMLRKISKWKNERERKNESNWVRFEL